MTLHIETTGSGPDVVLIHGWGIHGAVWHRVAEALSQAWCVHVVDLPGCGNSAMVAPYTLDSLAATLDLHFPLPVHVVGWSLGGAVGMQWVLSAPEKIRSLTLCASSPSFMQREDWLCATPEATLSQFATSLASDYVATIAMFLGLQVMGSQDGRAVLRQLQTRLAERPAPGPAALLEGLQILRDTDLRGRLTEISCPMLLQFGERDRMTPPGAGQWLASHCGAKLIQHAGAGHAPFISHERDFLMAQHAFLESV